MEGIEAAIPRYVHAVLDALERAGFRGYPVGGCLRDLLLGVTPYDFDVTTDAMPQDLPQIFGDFHTVPTGLSHGTVTVLSEGHPIEVTAHRAESGYSDSRHPDRVAFGVSLADDLARRDFTVNAMAWSRGEGLIDLFEGRSDLSRRILRAVGDPEARFCEDALRILRCFRFAAQLDFTVEPDTLSAAKACREGLSRISAERIFSELCRLLVSPAAVRGLALMDEAQCIPFVFFGTDPDRAAFARLIELPADAALRLAALLSHEPTERVRRLCRDLRTSNRFSDTVCGYIDSLGDELPSSSYAARRFVCHHFPYFREALLLRRAIHGTDVTDAERLTNSVFRDKSAIELRRLAVNGKELQDTVGVSPANTAKLLLLLQDLVWQDPDRNKKAVLLRAASEILKKGTLT